MRFLVDNSLSPRVAEQLCADGHDAIHVRVIGLRDSPDELIFGAAAGADRIVVSMDTDFGTLLANRRSTRPSVILSRRQHRSTESVMRLLRRTLENIATELESGAVAVFEDGRIRIRTLPIA